MDRLFARASETERTPRVPQNATEGKLEKKEKRREESTRVGRNCYGKRVYEVPVDRMPSERGKGCTSLVFERGKVLSCRV